MNLPRALVPPGLPEPLEDAAADPGPLSSWDMLAIAVIKDSSRSYNNRCRVRWKRFALLRWCCGRRMRLGVIEYQDRKVTFGWQADRHGFIACGRCGRFKDLL